MPSDPVRVLLMEDDAGLARLCRLKLQKAGYAATTASNGEEGLALFDAGCYDVVAVDQNMPGYDGLEVLRRLASRGRPVPVVMVTGAGSERTAVEAMKLGARDYVVKDADGAYLDLLPTVIDRALRLQRAEEALRESEARFRELAELLPETVFELSTVGRLTFLNRAGLEQFGYTREDVEKGLSAVDVTPQEHRAECREHITRLLRGEEPTTNEFVGLRKDGTTFPANFCATRIVRDGRPVGVRGILVNVTRQKAFERQLAEANDRLEAANRKLQELATTDELTGLWNRRHFFEVLRQEFQRVRRHGPGLAVAILDLDLFKAVNDTYGHAFGDRVLAEVAKVLRREVRETDVAARYGGEELVVLMPNTSTEEALSAVERIRKKVAVRYISDGKRAVQVTLSAGIAALEAGGGGTMESVLRLADEALYAAKHTGRNCTRTWSQICRAENEEALAQVGQVQDLQRQIGSLSLQAKELFVQSTQALVQAQEARDPYAKWHSVHVTQYAVGIAEAMGLAPEEVAVIRSAAVVHDIGKIGVPDAVLKKQGSLTDPERRIMEQHVLTGVRILDEMHFLDRELPIVRHHHEHWDGKGYPDGISGEAIPVGARVLAVADALDSITSERVYRAARPLSEAVQILLEGSGSHFDPAAVEGLIQWLIQTGRHIGAADALTTADLLATLDTAGARE